MQSAGVVEGEWTGNATSCMRVPKAISNFFYRLRIVSGQSEDFQTILSLRQK